MNKGRIICRKQNPFLSKARYLHFTQNFAIAWRQDNGGEGLSQVRDNRSFFFTTPPTVTPARVDRLFLE